MRTEFKEYYFGNKACKAKDQNEPDCICWHREGTGPLPDLTYEKFVKDPKSTVTTFWRTKTIECEQVEIPEEAEEIDEDAISLFVEDLKDAIDGAKAKDEIRGCRSAFDFLITRVERTIERALERGKTTKRENLSKLVKDIVKLTEGVDKINDLVKKVDDIERAVKESHLKPIPIPTYPAEYPKFPTDPMLFGDFERKFEVRDDGFALKTET